MMDGPTDLPPNKKVKWGTEFVELIDSCYNIMFNGASDDAAKLQADIKKICEALEQATSSSDIPFGQTKIETKINWGKCLGLMLECPQESLKALKVLTGKLNPGCGLLNET